MDELKLKQILFQEAAQSVEGSLGKGIAAIKSDQAIALFSTRRVMSIFQRVKQQKTSSQKLSDTLANDAVVGTVSYYYLGNDLYSVTSSAGVNKFGPLTYQLVMYLINPQWLRSDGSLTTGDDDSRIGGSQSIWNKMYELSNKGVYERKWLGSFFTDDTLRARKLVYTKMVNGPTEEALEDYDPKEDTSEEAFLNYLGDEGYQPSDFGHFWAYRLQASDPKTQELFDAGDVLKRNIAALGIPGMAPFNINEALDLAADLFFHRRYVH